ncbi:hypothetical protein NDU88_003849 [Pleurodeles waltl]|uniref:Uncharacterized protein n=1 Tax=Pleurodeles waltl TaxID=8319 RepID=A0AAV7UDN7_PLEWA|nr:hypothetical protein NDU88_003849 [Pleurodeles waltl]
MTADSLFFRVQRSSVRGIHRVFLCSKACLYLNQRLRRTVSTPSPLQDRSSHIAFGISSVAGQPSVLCLNRRPRCTVSTPSPKQDRSSHIAVEIAYHMHTLAAILEISTEIGSREDDNDVVVCSVCELLDGALDEQEWREACETDQDMKSGICAVVTGCIVIREEMCWDVHVRRPVVRLSWGTGENGTRNVMCDLNFAGQWLCSGRCGWLELGAVNVGSEE